jgi:hypothetical protein
VGYKAHVKALLTSSRDEETKVRDNQPTGKYSKKSLRETNPEVEEDASHELNTSAHCRKRQPLSANPPARPTD